VSAPLSVLAGGAGPRRVLVVEDDPALRALFAEVLAEEGCRVLVAAHAPDPVDVLQLRPDLLVLDLVLGGADGADGGWRLLRALRAYPGGARVPVLVCTADHALARREAAGLAALADAVLLKPFGLDDLLRHLRPGGGPGRGAAGHDAGREPAGVGRGDDRDRTEARQG
jgi:CheY-like chemotaxis protein